MLLKQTIIAVIIFFILLTTTVFDLVLAQTTTEGIPDWYFNPPQTRVENGNIHFSGISIGISYEIALANSIAAVANQVHINLEQLEKMKSEMTGLPYHTRSESISLTLDSLDIMVSQEANAEEININGELSYRDRYSHFVRIEYGNNKNGYTILKSEDEDAENENSSYRNRFTIEERNYGAKSFHNYLNNSSKWEIVAHKEIESTHYLHIKFIDDLEKYKIR